MLIPAPRASQKRSNPLQRSYQTRSFLHPSRGTGLLRRPVLSLLLYLEAGYFHHTGWASRVHTLRADISSHHQEVHLAQGLDHYVVFICKQPALSPSLPPPRGE